MHHIKCPVLVQKEHNASEAYSLLASTTEESLSSENAKIDIKCHIASCAVRSLLTDRSELSGKMMTFVVVDPESCAHNESPIEPDMRVAFPNTPSKKF